MDYFEFWQAAKKYKMQFSLLAWSWIPVCMAVVSIWVYVLKLELSNYLLFGIMGIFLYTNYRIAKKLQALICPKCGCTAFEGGGGGGFFGGLQCRLCGLTENENT